MSFRARCRRVLGLLLIGLLVCAASARAADGPTITLVWDPNPEPDVTGYIVYVARGIRDRGEEQYDVGPTTRFPYPGSITSGTAFLFWVAAYNNRGQVSPRSEPVFYMRGAFSAPSSSSRSTVTGGSASASLLAPAATVVEHDLAAATAATASVVKTLTALATLPDGRVMFAEDGQRLRLGIAADATVPMVLEVSGDDTKIVGLAVDPAFSATRFVYVTFAEQQSAAIQQVRIVRYRELGGVLGEPIVIATGIPSVVSSSVPVAVDGKGRIYVAVPRVAGTSVSPYDGTILRFEGDGTVPKDNYLGSPIYTRGDDRPVALVADPGTGNLWIAGNDSSSLRRVVTDAGSPAGTVMSAVMRLAPAASGVSSLSLRSSTEGVLVDTDGQLRTVVLTGATLATSPLSLPSGAVPLLASVYSDGTIAVVVRDSADQTPRIVHLPASVWQIN